MTIMIDEHLLALWAAPLPGPPAGDFLAGLSRDPATPGKPLAYVLGWRIKIFASAAGFDPRDMRRWKSYTLHGENDDDVLRKVRQAISMMTAEWGTAVDMTEIVRAPGETDEAIAKRIMALPWAHSMHATDKELEQYEAQIRAAEEQRRGRK